MRALQHTPNPSDGAFHLNGISHARNALQSKGSRKPKRPMLDDLKRLADWHGYDGHRGCVIYVFSRTLSRETCEQWGLRYPALEPRLYCAVDAIAPDQYHPDAGIAAGAFDGRRA